MIEQKVGMCQEPVSSICPYCHRMLYRLDGILDEGIAYHKQCYLYKIGKRRDRLRNKLKGKTITLNEAEELTDAEIIYNNIYKDFKKPQISIKELMAPEQMDDDWDIEKDNISQGHKNLLRHRAKLALYKQNESARLTAQKEKKELVGSAQKKAILLPAPEAENDL